MTVLIPNSTILDRFISEKSNNTGSTQTNHSMSSRQSCLCCSNPLLRHIDLGKLYWRCNRCYQAMPVMEDAQDMLQCVPQGGVSTRLLFRKCRQEQQNVEMESHERSISNFVITPTIHSG